MDEILQRFQNTLGSGRGDDQSHKDLYKNWGKYGNQEERRIEILRQQKSDRENNLDNCRGILDLMECVEENPIVFKKSSKAKYQPTVYVPGFSNTTNSYDNVLMLSEWMVEKPEDFSTNWYVTPCPKGTRTLVIACNGMTRFYSKYGQLIYTTSTLLPGGNRNETSKKCSILDCFYCKDTKILHVLDVLSWNNHIMADGEMEFRCYWLQTLFIEHPELEITSIRNKVSFKLLQMTPCDPDSFQQFMLTYPPLEEGKLDGLLFYHRHGHYVAGETPLVGWLYPYMVPEVLCPGMTIHKAYAARKPLDYVDQATFIRQFEQKSRRKPPFKRVQKKTQSTSETSMEAEDGPGEEFDTVENEITEHDVNKNATGGSGDGATMETENGAHQAQNAVNVENRATNTESGENRERALDEVGSSILFASLRSYQNPTPEGTVNKYYSYFK